MNLRMAGQDLLHQCAARTRHADDEHRNRRGIARLVEAIEQRPVEYCGNALEKLELGRFLVVDMAAFECIAFTQMFKGAGIITGVFVRFRQSEMDVRRPVGG